VYIGAESFVCTAGLTDRLRSTNQIATKAMQPHIHTDSDLDAGLAALSRADPRFGPLMATAGRPPLRRRPDGFAGLAAIIVAQQLSTASASAIWGRLAAAFDPLEHSALLRARPVRLARLGLSGPKIRALKAIARSIESGELALAMLADLAPEAAHAALTAIHGIGPWTADIYLLSCLGHADAWPAGDLALQEAARVAFGLPSRPTAKEMQALAETWRPWRAVAARVLWTYYRTVKGREGAPLEPGRAKRGKNGR
jgi:DNA-3-methyladenine glycosylase II